ncbi:MAG TPA: hypothetical protein VFG83_06685 [Kofleriaceae bacterium]|nr:hypothetical protein [Kofleriaceae bacterium]
MASDETPRDPARDSGEKSELKGAIYRDFDSFLKVGIREYYDRGWTSRKGNFIALLIASGQTAMAMAKDSVVDGSGTKKVAIGAATALALKVGLRYALGGPLGLVLTVAASASLVSYFIRNQRDIIKKVGKYRVVIRETRTRYEELQANWRDGRYDDTDRNLMIDGLMKRFISQIDNPP